jgi:hypothetical protein
MCRAGLALVFVIALAALASGAERVFCADPEKGDDAADGSRERPWKTLAGAARAGRLKALEAGGTLLLRSGDHGAVTLSGDNKEMVTIAAEEGQKPRISRLEIRQGSKWTIKGLTVSPSFGKPYKGSIVTLAEGGPSSELVLENCFVYTALDTSAWKVEDWMKANSGIFMGRHGTRITLRNNHVQNTRFGISLCAPDSLCEGNLVSDFSGDGMRVTRDGLVVQYNVIKNGCCSAADGDGNHDDGIQCFLFNKGTGTVRNVTVRGNVIVNREDKAQKFPAQIQGIGFFDGPLVDFVVENNVVLVDHWHGVSLYDAQNCKITGNAVYSIWREGKARPWVMLGQKQKAAKGNTVTGNLAFKFPLKDDPEVKAEKNETVTAESFGKALKQAMATINEKFGEAHPVSGARRLGAMEIK